MLHSPHVVEAVCKLDKHDADIRYHRQDHLAKVLSLLLFAREIADVRYLCQTVDKKRYLVAKICTDSINIDKSVLNDIVKQPGGDAGLIEPHVCKDVSNLKGMNEIRFARSTRLTAMVER